MSEPFGWLAEAGPERDVVLSTRARVARNLVGCRFPHRASDEERIDVAEAVKAALRDGRPAIWRFVEPDAMGGRGDSYALLCAAMARPAFGRRAGEVLAAASDGCSFVLINEEDHVRVQRIEAGLRTDSCRSGAGDIEGVLAGALAIAHDLRWGYLAASPANSGLGLRISAMVHVPGLAAQGRLDRLFRAAERLGLTARGAFGEGTRGLGHVYQISNQGAGGGDAERVETAVHAAAAEVVAAEREARADLAHAQLESIELAAEKGARLLRPSEWVGADVGQLLRAWSDVRLARALGVDGRPSFERLTAMLADWGRRFGTHPAASVLYK